MFELKEIFDFYYWCTPNGDKVLILFEELGLNYRIKPINILRGEQYDKAFLAISPNNKIPAIHQSSSKLSLFESGAILLTLAEQSGKLLTQENRLAVLQWLFWQVGGLGPMAGQNHHFNHYAPEKISYAVDRYNNETERLYRVLEQQLQNKEYIASEFSIADIACYPWVACYELQHIDLANFPNIQAWYNRMEQRASVKKAKMINNALSKDNQFDEQARQFMFK